MTQPVTISWKVAAVKKLILLAAVAAGIGYLVKFKSEQVKTAAAKVTRDPRVQSALATASEKAGPVAASVSSTASSVGSTVGSAVGDRLHKSASDEDLTPPAVPEPAVEVAEGDPVSAPEFSGFEAPKTESTDAAPDPLTDPIETLEDPEQ